MKLTHKHKVFICQKLAECESLEGVIGAFEQEFGERIFKSRVIYYRDAPKWSGLIRELHEKWLAGLTEEIMAKKRIRLRRLDAVYQKSMESAFAGCDQFGNEKHTFSPTGAVSAIKQAQEEVEGRKVRLAGHDGKGLKLSLAERLVQLNDEGKL